ncbi:uncharacterized protein LOC121235034 [Juglans microcarpa x Juglans regia]|uniref:uncharacterized protein LOC121235034 n=1 Tax=Juglans microcarpa x Juglans regia TaxID=2249226 RepID=UPI001B7F0D1A|nr:uncharacterized protein LOC121235034 [Juglans microcarpa x Juglans regia]
MEPFQSIDKVQRYMRALQFDKVITNEEVGGKIWAFWMNKLDVQVVRMGTQYLSLRIADGDSQFLGNFIYAKCSRIERQILWEEMSSSNMGMDNCLFAGDFNINRLDLEIRGGKPRSRAAIEDFNRWIHQGRLIEMKSQERNFSWCNGQQGLARAWAKLDRVLLDPTLISAFPNAICYYLPRTTSDHSPMFIEFLKDPYSYGPSPFRFQQMWIEHPDFMSFVQYVWSEPIVGTGHEKLASKLKKMRVALREWNKRAFGQTNTQIAILEEKVEGLEGNLQGVWDEEVERELVGSYKELSSWSRREDIRLAQMEKIKWKMEGDRNSNFFHVWLTNKRRKRILKLRTTDGIEFNSPEEIHLGAVNYFSGFLQNSNQTS